MGEELGDALGAALSLGELGPSLGTLATRMSAGDELGVLLRPHWA
jgi:hypothetical protein